MTGTVPMADRVLVLGGGLAGVACAHTLGDEGIDVTLVDRNDYHQFQPLLYQVASSQLPAEDIARPHRTIFKDYPSVEVVTAEVVAANLAERNLVLSDGRTLTGSHVVMAAGARPNFFGVPGAAKHAFPLYSWPMPSGCDGTCSGCCKRRCPGTARVSRARWMWSWSVGGRPAWRRLGRWPR